MRRHAVMSSGQIAQSTLGFIKVFTLPDSIRFLRNFHSSTPRSMGARPQVVEEFMSIADGQTVLRGGGDAAAAGVVVDARLSVSRIGSRAFPPALEGLAPQIRPVGSRSSAIFLSRPLCYCAAVQICRRLPADATPHNATSGGSNQGFCRQRCRSVNAEAYRHIMSPHSAPAVGHHAL